MSTNSDWVEVLVFAAVAGFVSWRLISVLGRRTGHEPTAQPDGEGTLFAPPTPVAVPSARTTPSVPQRQEPLSLPVHWSPDLKKSVTALAEADPSFAPDSFLSNARSAYGLILSSFWSGDTSALKALVADEVLTTFARSIEMRDGSKITGQRLVDIISAEIIDAGVNNAMAEVVVRFEARIEDHNETHITTDIWTFSRHVRSDDPSWLLIATDNT